MIRVLAIVALGLVAACGADGTPTIGGQATVGIGSATTVSVTGEGYVGVVIGG